MDQGAWVLWISLVGWWPSPAHAQYGATNGEWRSYGGDLGSTKCSPLDQIDRTNFGDLEIAWRWRSVDGALDLETLRERLWTRLGVHPIIELVAEGTIPRTEFKARRVIDNRNLYRQSLDRG